MLRKTITISLLTISTLAYAGQAPSDYPEGELGRMVKLGEDIMKNTNTHPLTAELVGNKLTCGSCHLSGSDGRVGTTDGLGTFIGTAAAFPAFSKREKTVQTLQDRINNCFMRSMNGIRPIVDTEMSVAMAAYITWLSTGTPIKMDDKRPVNAKYSDLWAKKQKLFAGIQKQATHENYLAGEKIYKEQCMACHGDDGQGVANFPPLWGKNDAGEWLAYNTGAGMSKLNKAPAWIQIHMPVGKENTLSDQEAADIALYMNAQPLANFDLQEHLSAKKEMGVYNSKVLDEKHSVRSNFEAFGLNVDEIRGDNVIE